MYIGEGINPKDIPFGEIVSAFPFEGKIYVFGHCRVYIHDAKDPPGEFKELPINVRRNTSYGIWAAAGKNY